jgi:hypothetical protein
LRFPDYRIHNSITTCGVTIVTDTLRGPGS